MRNFRNILFICLLVLCSLTLFGCGKKANKSKSVSEVRAEAEKMDVKQLRTMALKYKDVIMTKKDEIAQATAELKNIPLADMLGEEAQGLKSEIEELTKSAVALKERFQIYYNKIKEKGGDLSDLRL